MGTIASDPAAARRGELANFLRARRASLQPADVNLCPPPGRRNTPGLRREEVAQISGVGLTWYTWLEQARPITISDHIIDALAHALRLDRETHRHLRRLAGLPVPHIVPLPAEATSELVRILDSLMPLPASILGPRFDYVVWNEAHNCLWQLDSHPPEERNVMWLAFMDPHLRHMTVGWEERTRHTLAHFRAASGEYAGDLRFAELIDSLQTSSPDFQAMWAEYIVGESLAGPLVLRHPSVGLIRLDVAQLQVLGQPSLTLNIQMPHQATDRARLELLTRPSEDQPSPIPSKASPSTKERRASNLDTSSRRANRRFP